MPAAAEAVGDPPPVLEFDIAAGDSDRLLRLATIASMRQGRAKTTPVQLVWHDTPAEDLARQGLSLAEQRGRWRLERLTPNGAGDWLPAAPAPILGEADHPHALVQTPPDELVPVAGFTGRRRHIVLQHSTGPATLTLLEGVLRGLTAEKPTCRLTLAGDPAGMAGLAAEISKDISLTIPRAGLAANAVAVARGRDSAPRQLGAPAVPSHLTVDAAITLVTAHLADVILYWAPLTRLESGPNPVHQMRVAVRRMRSALSIFRRASGGPEEAELAKALKMLAGRLGAARDWDVFLTGTAAAVQSAFPADKRIAALIAAAVRKRQAAYAALSADMASQPWQTMALNLALLPTRRPWASTDQPEQLDLLASPVTQYAAARLHHRLKQTLALGKDLAAQPADQLHDVRKQAKRLRYAAEFFAPLFSGKAARRFLKRLEDLQEALGAVNDAAVATALMSQLEVAGADRAFATGAVLGFVAAGGQDATRQALRAWKRFLAAEPFWT